METSIESTELQTLEDEFSGKFCECRHLVAEHFVGVITKTTKCYALWFNGAIWVGCYCTRVKVIKPSFRFTLDNKLGE